MTRGMQYRVALVDDPREELERYRLRHPEIAQLWEPHDEISFIAPTDFSGLERIMTELPEWTPYAPPIRLNYATLSDSRGAREGWLALMYGKPLPPHRGHVVPPPPPLTKRQRRRRRGKSRS